jgi:hypothetical protein
MHEEWAERYADRLGTTVVNSVDDILDDLVAIAAPAWTSVRITQSAAGRYLNGTVTGPSKRR